MPNSNTNTKTNAAFYHSLGKVLTESSNLVGNEKYKSSHNVSSSEIWMNTISYAPTIASSSQYSDNVVVRQIGTVSNPAYLYPLSNTNYQTWFIDTGTPSATTTGFIPSSDWAKSLINPSDAPSSSGEPSFGYQLKMYRRDGTTAISYDNTYYDVDYFSGLIRFDQGYTPIDLSTSSGLGFTFNKTTFESTANNLKKDYIQNSSTGGPRVIAWQYVGQRLDSYISNIGGSVGNILYVSIYGDDDTAIVGKISRPWASIQSARDSASSGDIIYVLPGTWTYDNRDSTGNQYNGVVDSMVNLWKDGVTYYFSPGTKIIIYNQTITGADMYLFRPNSGAFSKCSVLGHLEYEQYSTGPDTYNGRCHYLSGSVASTDYGYEFYSETKSLKSECSELIKYDRSTSLTNTTKITIISEYSEYIYTSGQSGSAGMFTIQHTGTDRLEFKSSIKFSSFSFYFPFYIRSNQNSYINLYGNEVYTTSNGGLFLLYNCSANIGCHFDKIYYTNTWTAYWAGCIINSGGTGGWKMDIKADLIDSNSNSNTTGIFWIHSSDNILNYTGNIVTKTSSGSGRFIANTSLVNTININGDITFLGSSTTTATLFTTNNSGAIINYTGRITGNFAGAIVDTYNGTTNITNSFIQLSVDNTNSKIFKNSATQSGTVRINNSYIEMINGYSTLSSGSYVKTLINNSTIINTGSQSVFYNISGQDNLQILNSTIITNGTMSINYGQTSSVISSNSVTNKNFNIENIYGNINVIDSLIY